MPLLLESNKAGGLGPSVPQGLPLATAFSPARVGKVGKGAGKPFPAFALKGTARKKSKQKI